MRNEVGLLPGHDVHLRIWLGGVAFDYRATAIAAWSLMCDSQRRRWYGIELIRDSADTALLLPRLPNERLFLEPDSAGRPTQPESRTRPFTGLADRSGG